MSDRNSISVFTLGVMDGWLAHLTKGTYGMLGNGEGVTFWLTSFFYDSEPLTPAATDFAFFFCFAF